MDRDNKRNRTREDTKKIWSYFSFFMSWMLFLICYLTAFESFLLKSNIIGYLRGLNSHLLLVNGPLQARKNTKHIFCKSHQKSFFRTSNMFGDFCWECGYKHHDYHDRRPIALSAVRIWIVLRTPTRYEVYSEFPILLWFW